MSALSILISKTKEELASRIVRLEAEREANRSEVKSLLDQIGPLNFEINSQNVKIKELEKKLEAPTQLVPAPDLESIVRRQDNMYIALQSITLATNKDREFLDKLAGLWSASSETVSNLRFAWLDSLNDSR